MDVDDDLARIAPIKTTIAAWFRACRAEIPETQRWRLVAELQDLEESLDADASALEVLVNKYKLDLRGLLERLRDHRLTWRFANNYRIAERWTAGDIARMARHTKKVADFLTDASSLLRQVWSQQPPTPNVEQAFGPFNENIHQVDGEDYDLWQRTCLHEQIDGAILILRKTTDAIRAIKWTTLADYEGTKLYRRGPRRRLIYERGVAQELVALFTAETDHALYAYVGVLLRATFPSLATWRSAAKKPLEVRVKQLLAVGSPRTRSKRRPM